jgi:hypothetical protein
MSKVLSDPLLQVQYATDFPKELIQSFAFASVGCFTLTFNTNGELLRAEARLHDATYKHLIVDDPNILEAIGNSYDTKEPPDFPPLTKFRLDPFDEPDFESEAPWPDTARLVEITGLPKMAMYGKQWEVNPLEPPRGAVHARLETIWGEDVGGDKRKLAEPRPTLAAPTKRCTMSMRSQGSSTLSDVPSDSIEKRPVINRNNDAHLSTIAESSNEGSPAQFQRGTSVESTPSDHTASSDATVLAPSGTDHRCKNRSRCKYCLKTPSHPWVPGGPFGLEMAKVLIKINARIPEDAQFEYGRMFNIERRIVAKKTKPVRDEFRDKLQKFLVQHNIVELHNEFTALHRKTGPNSAYLLPIFNVGIDGADREDSAVGTENIDGAHKGAIVSQ